jgi:hypothetical protein
MGEDYPHLAENWAFKGRFAEYGGTYEKHGRKHPKGFSHGGKKNG